MNMHILPYILMSVYHMYALCPWRLEKGTGCLELELQMVVRHNVGAGSCERIVSALNTKSTLQPLVHTFQRVVNNDHSGLSWIDNWGQPYVTTACLLFTEPGYLGKQV